MRLFWASLLCLLTLSAGAQDKPRIKSFSDKGFIFGRMSDNGRWVTQYQETDATKSPQLIDLSTYKTINLQSTDDIALHGCAVPIDVTDDGNLLVGSYDGVPAYLDRTTGKWTQLSRQAGSIFAVTPDGRYAVGAINNGDTGMNGEQLAWFTEEQPKMWNLATGEEVTVPAVPTTDPKGNASQMIRFTDISPDGRYVVGSVFVDYPDYAFVIDRELGNLHYVGYRQAADGKTYECAVSNMFFNSPRTLSPDGHWLVCNGYFVASSDEFYAPIRYNIETGETTAYSTGSDDHDMYGNLIDNDGNIYGATPSGSPIREFYIRSGRYWYGLRSVLAQRYGMDFTADTGLDNTGTPYSISSDGLTFTAMVDPQFGQNMVMKMNEPLVDVCRGLNLLSTYTITPTPGAQFSNLSQIRVRFDRDIEVIGEQTAATFGSWRSLGGNGIYVDPTDSRTVIVAFRSRTLTAGQRYTFTIPAGTICICGDREQTNTDITAEFIGRSDKPVSVLDVYPKSGSVIAKLDNQSSYVQLAMDCNVTVADDAEAWLSTKADGKRISNLQVAYKDNIVALFPPTTQYLYKDVEYTVTLRAGAVTDVMGGGAMTDDVVLSYTGSYERETTQGNGVLFTDNFDNISNSLAQWLLYDGDGNTPTEEMQAMEYDADNTPWNFSIHEVEASTDYCAASHSCYKPAGTSCDWMLTPQIFVPDNLARLTFQAQSYRQAKHDVLQVYVWENDEALTHLNASHYRAMKADGKLVLETVLTPGADEERLADEWQDFSIDLSAYAGKNIYICFGNENNDQSMIFVDNVRVFRDLPFILSLTTPEAVENETCVRVAGKLAIQNDAYIYNKVYLALKDADGNRISATEQQTGLHLTKGDEYTFTFADALPLTIGEINRYSIDVYLDDVLTTVDYSIRDLVFTPIKHVVLEEMTGQPCGNCPQGILAIEQMQRMYGSRFIPVSIHTYTGDPWAAGLTSYSSFLNLDAAPTAVVQRHPGILMPMKQNSEGKYTFTADGEMWMDHVSEEIERAADIEVSARVNYDSEAQTFSVPTTVRSAINLSDININIFMVLMEDGLVARQRNYFASFTDPIFGEWGQGGRYGQTVASGVTHNDVVRAVLGNSYAGVVGLLPQAMEAGREYTPSRTLGGTLPGTVEQPMNAKVAVMLIDANTGCILNACVAHFDPSRDENDRNDGIHDITTSTPRADKTYNLQGQEVGPSYHGIAIRGGRKIVL